jgi:hypothetical protein
MFHTVSKSSNKNKQTIKQENNNNNKKKNSLPFSYNLDSTYCFGKNFKGWEFFAKIEVQ